MFKEPSGKIIYIGKAKSLRNRVRSYFQKLHEDLKTNVLVSKIADIQVQVTSSELEALLLEAELIKKFKPQYNIDLRDDKAYPYLKLTMDERYPRLFLTRRIEGD
ncbi:MAG: GIY-YIG nuclease family protein, partial [bacterium]